MKVVLLKDVKGTGKAGEVCRRMIEELTAEPEPGRVYKGKVKTIIC